jgi:ABC-type lipoprotein export system ATPase subunit
MVTHDPRMAAYAGRVLYLRDGVLVSDNASAPEDVLAGTDRPA